MRPVPTVRPPVLLALALCALLALPGCRPVPDRWSQTAALCADSPGPDQLDAACAEALDQDFAVDSDAFEPDDLAVLRAGLYTLLVREAGDRSALDRRAAPHRPLARHLRHAARSGDLDDLGAAAYNLAAAQIVSIHPQQFEQADWRAAYDTETGEIGVRAPLSDPAESMALLLFHESMHGLAPGHVPCPEDPADGCDRRWTGAYGLQADYADLLLAHCDWEQEEASCRLLDNAAHNGRARVLAARARTW